MRRVDCAVPARPTPLASCQTLQPQLCYYLKTLLLALLAMLGVPGGAGGLISYHRQPERQYRHLGGAECASRYDMGSTAAHKPKRALCIAGALLHWAMLASSTSTDASRALDTPSHPPST